MRLSKFIRRNRAPIIEAWEQFARKLKPSADISALELTDHIDEILTFVADDIETVQTAGEQRDKSEGKAAPRGDGTETAAQIHATLRHDIGFDIVEMVSEYRALRATITRLWHRAADADIEHQREDLERLNEAVDQAVAESVLRFTQDVDKARHLLLGVLGHDIRSPVGAIQMAARLIPDLGPANDRQRQMLDQIDISAVRIQKIVDDLLDLAKTSASGQTLPVHRQLCSLSDLCHRIVGEARARNPTREFVLRTPERCEGQWDDIRIGQVLSNLLGNAVQYGAHDAPVVVELIDLGPAVLLSVHNRGEPIPPARFETIFKSFTRGPESHSERETPTANLGLGLFISKEIVAAHQGQIEVRSSSERGTTFLVTLPK